MSSFYAVCALRTGELDAPNQIMLYRFRSSNARHYWCELSDYRLAVTRDIARLLFPKLRKHARDPQYWAEMEVSLIAHDDVPKRLRPNKALCEYMLDPLTGGVAHTSWEMIPDKIPNSETIKNKFRRELETAKWRSQFVK